MLLLFHLLSALCFYTSLVQSVIIPAGVKDPECNPAQDYGQPVFFDCINAYLKMHSAENARTAIQGGQEGGEYLHRA